MGPMTKSGQFSIEFIVVWGVLLLVVATVTLPLYESSSDDAQEMTDLSQARKAANKIASALNTVYSGGVGSKQTVKYSLPGGVRQIRVDENVDGTDDVPRDNRMDVQIVMNWEGNNIVLINTLLPSQYIDDWQEVPLIDSNLSKSFGDHLVKVSYDNFPKIVLEEI